MTEDCNFSKYLTLKFLEIWVSDLSMKNNVQKSYVFLEVEAKIHTFLVWFQMVIKRVKQSRKDFSQNSFFHIRVDLRLQNKSGSLEQIEAILV